MKNDIRTSRWVALVACSVGGLACGATPPSPTSEGVEIAPDRVVPSARAAAPTTTGEATTPRTATRDPSAFHFPGDRPKIGATCAGEAFCGTAGRIAVEEDRYSGFKPRETTWTPPCDPQSLSREPSDIDARAACLDGPYLFARAECRMCRMPSFREVIAKTDELTPAQATEIARLLALPQPTPTTPDAWARAIEGRVSR